MQIYQNHVVFQSFSDLYYVDMAEQQRNERRRQALAAIQAAAAMSNVREQYNALRKNRSRHEADALYHQLITKGVSVNASNDDARVRWADNSAIVEEEQASSSSSSPASTPTTSRTPSLLRGSRSTGRRRSSSSSVDTDATSMHSVDAASDAHARSKAARHPHFYVGGAHDDEEDLSYPAALYSSRIAQRRQRKEADMVTLEDAPGIAGQHDLSLQRF